MGSEREVQDGPSSLVSGVLLAVVESVSVAWLPERSTVLWGSRSCRPLA
jgi:hypothetical protein